MANEHTTTEKKATHHAAARIGACLPARVEPPCPTSVLPSGTALGVVGEKAIKNLFTPIPFVAASIASDPTTEEVVGNGYEGNSDHDHFQRDEHLHWLRAGVDVLQNQKALDDREERHIHQCRHTPGQPEADFSAQRLLGLVLLCHDAAPPSEVGGITHPGAGRGDDLRVDVVRDDHADAHRTKEVSSSGTDGLLLLVCVRTGALISKLLERGTNGVARVFGSTRCDVADRRLRTATLRRDLRLTPSSVLQSRNESRPICHGRNNIGIPVFCRGIPFSLSARLYLPWQNE